jgi:hypothetical protein
LQYSKGQTLNGPYCGAVACQKRRPCDDEFREAQALQRLMRHSSLQTTLTYYVGDIGLEDQLWADFGNKSGNIASPVAEGGLKKALENKPFCE